MKVLHTSDWHIGNFPGPEKNGQNLRALDTETCLEYLYNYAKTECPDIIVVSGDIFHQARVWSDRGLAETQLAINHIERLSRIAPTVVMRGTPNHDGIENFEMLKTHFAYNNSVRIITEPCVAPVQVHGNPYDQVVYVACLPGFDRGVYRAKFPGLSKEEENQVFTEELGKIILALKAECHPTGTTILMSHYTVPGCNTESGQTMFLTQFEPVIMPEILDAANFDLVALGHIHRPQQVTSCKNTFYSGAINAMNFNDEGQERGFYVHDIDTNSHEFCKTPSREFITYKLNDSDIIDINSGDIDLVAQRFWLKPSTGCNGSIVRVLYECSEDREKAFNRALLEKRLYEDGAFWVSEISPSKVTIGTDKKELSEKTDPEINLISYLKEKAVDENKIGEIVELARPIIAAASAGNIVSRLAGTFIPVEIEVKNYRNYEAETFNFTDIAFCTINGKNGAGKSSLFMDAILDCIYEEPREGDLTGWIRADEKARSGAISFTFAIGDKTFRVARTRAKSGKATLNLSELVNTEWINRSAEKIKDTQQQIVDIIGMDSLTFRSCALIMQDQYGLFLQASKEERMAILGNILGLSIYTDMERLSRLELTEVNREIAKNKTMIDTLSLDISTEDAIVREFEVKTLDETIAQEGLRLSTGSRETLMRELNHLKDASARAEKLKIEIDNLNVKKKDLDAGRDEHRRSIVVNQALISLEEKIHENAKTHRETQEKEKILIQQVSELKSKISAIGDAKGDVTRIEADLRRLNTEHASFANQIEEKRTLLSREPELKSASDQLRAEKDALVLHEQKEKEYSALFKTIDEKKWAFSGEEAVFKSEATVRTAKITSLKNKTSMLENSGCIDVENADCSFLTDAQKAKTELEAYLPGCTEWKEGELARLNSLRSEINALEEKLGLIGHDADEAIRCKARILTLEDLARQYEQISSIKDTLGVLERSHASCSASIVEAEERLAHAKERAGDRQVASEECAVISAELEIVKDALEKNALWLEREKELPLAKERSATAQKRSDEITAEIEALDTDICAKTEELGKEMNASSDLALISAKIEDEDKRIAAFTFTIGELRKNLGALQNQIDVITKKKAEIQDIQDANITLSEKVARYNILKEAFSQDGIPHNIIRSILPHLTSTANSILGQMTGGKMGMEFITDKVLKSNNKKEVVTLDIVINEYGKDTLPYMSKSGGEKVKSSLSAILSLAEIKSSQAGIQLGMLFIDEPPFLDADGIQAYCDALQTIQTRYSHLKIMAITHDPTMKARFPQSIDVVKTENGSKVEIN